MLSEIVKKILSLTKDKAELDRKFTSLKQEIERYTNDISSVQLTHDTRLSELKKIKKNIHAADLEINALSDKEKAVRAQIPVTAKTKEQDALKREVLALQDNREKIEEELLDFLTEKENLEKTNSKKTPEENKAISEAKEKLLILEKHSEEFSSLISQKIEEIFQASALLPEGFKQKYKKILSSVEVPVVQIKNQSCSSCYAAFTSQQIADIKRKQIGECYNCGRILIYEL